MNKVSFNEAVNNFLQGIDSLEDDVMWMKPYWVTDRHIYPKEITHFSYPDKRVYNDFKENKWTNWIKPIQEKYRNNTELRDDIEKGEPLIFKKANYTVIFCNNLDKLLKARKELSAKF